MNKATLLIIFLMGMIAVQAQSIYSKAYGSPEDHPVIFLHGGPGYNSANFEASTAERLAANGFYVIVYDRRGEGRSKDVDAAFNFDQTFLDLLDLYGQYGFKKASVIGHSFGGIVATLFAKANPAKIESILLVGAPVSLQDSFKTIIRSSKAKYKADGDSQNLSYLNMLEKMDTTSLQYSSFCFYHAQQNGFYSPKEKTAEAKEIYARLKADTEMAGHATEMTYAAPQGFWENENYTTLDLSPDLTALKKQGMEIYGIYGKEDGLYAPEQIAELKEIIGEDHLRYLENASHNVFMDQQTQFIQAVREWLR